MVDMTSLQQLLQKELAILDELFNLSLSKTKAIMEDDLDALEKIVLTEEALSKSLKKTDDACSQQVQFFLQDQTKPPEELRNVLAKIRKTTAKLKEHNDLNQELLHDNIAMNQFMINALFAPADSGPAIYDSSGTIKGTDKKQSLLDCKG